MLLSANRADAKEPILVPPHQVVEIACRLAQPRFPTKLDILAIARIESGFNPKARNGISKGIMQVNHGPAGIEPNMRRGVEMLADLFDLTKSIRGSVLAYNSGISNWRRGIYSPLYFGKFLKAKSELKKLELPPC